MFGAAKQLMPGLEMPTTKIGYIQGHALRTHCLTPKDLRIRICCTHWHPHICCSNIENVEVTPSSGRWQSFRNCWNVSGLEVVTWAKHLAVGCGSGRENAPQHHQHLKWWFLSPFWEMLWSCLQRDWLVLGIFHWQECRVHPQEWAYEGIAPTTHGDRAKISRRCNDIQVANNPGPN